MTRTAYVELSSADVRIEALEAIGGGKDKPVKLKCFVGGAEISIKKAATECAMQRNAFLRRGSDVVKADSQAHGKVVKIARCNCG